MLTAVAAALIKKLMAILVVLDFILFIYTHVQKTWSRLKLLSLRLQRLDVRLCNSVCPRRNELQCNLFNWFHVFGYALEETIFLHKSRA
jgi:hypothetical protein